MCAATALAASIALTLPACHSKPAAVQPAVPIDTRSRIPTDEASKALPTDLPSKMPIYPGSEIEHVRKPRGAMREIIFSSPGQVNDLVAYFKDGLKKGEFHITSSLIMPARKTWSCDFQKNGRPGSVMLYPSDADKTRLTIDLIYEMPPSKLDEALIEPIEDFDVMGPGEVAQKAPNPNPKEKRN